MVEITGSYSKAVVQCCVVPERSSRKRIIPDARLSVTCVNVISYLSIFLRALFLEYVLNGLLWRLR